MSEEGLSSEDMWLQDSEARLESMEILLKSVRRDIDALSEKLPSPRPYSHLTFRQEEPVIHESGNKNYVLRIDRRPKGYQNLGLGSHTTREPFDVDDDNEKPVNNAQLQKTWRSPTDFRANDSPPDSPAFGESSGIISFNDVIIPNESIHLNSEEVESDRIIPLLGSQHSLPTIEENSQEDNTDSSSISTAEDLKSADYLFRQRLASAVSCTSSSDAIVDLSRAGLSHNTMSKGSLNEIKSSLPEQCKYAPLPLRRLPSHAPSVMDSDSLRYSCTSLRSRDSMISETDSFVTVNSQFSPSGEEAYVTACSDNDGLGDSADEGRRRMLVLQQNLSPGCQYQSEDVLEFTLVEAATCETPVARKKITFFEKPEKSTDISGDSEKKPTKRRALRKRKLEGLSQDYDEESDTSSVSICDEVIYGAGTSKTTDQRALYFDDDTLIIPSNPQASCLLPSLDSPSEEDDIVVHFANNDTEVVTKEMDDIARYRTQHVDIPEGVLTHLDNVTPANTINDFDEKCLECNDSFEVGKNEANNKEYISSIVPDDCNDLVFFPSPPNKVLHTDSHLDSEYLNSINLSMFDPQIDLPKQRTDHRSHRSRMDFMPDPRFSNVLSNDDAGLTSNLLSSQNELLDLPPKLTQRSKSVSRPTENINSSFQAHLESSGVEKGQNNERMYSRSCSRYRSTDIDVVMATTISGDNLVKNFLDYNSKSKKMASSLFDLSVRRQLSMSNNLQFIHGKSTNSLLETDIDTGRLNSKQIILETDVDTLDTYQIVGDFTEATEGSIPSTHNKTCSLFNLASLNSTGYPQRFLLDENKRKSGPETYKRAESVSGMARDINSQRLQPKSGSSSLVARLRSRARSNHELRVAESLVRIHVPEWFDKADLSRPISPLRRTASPLPTREVSILPRYGTSLPTPAAVQGLSTKGVETCQTVKPVSKPTLSSNSSSRIQPRRSLRPSQILRDRNASSGPRLLPIKSFLRSSTKSQIGEGANDFSIGHLAVSEGATVASPLCPVDLTSEDFLTYDEKYRVDGSNAKVVLPTVCSTGAPTPVTLPSSASPLAHSAPLQKTRCQNGKSKRANGEAPICNSNGSGGSIDTSYSDNVVNNQFYQLRETMESRQSGNSFVDRDIYEEVRSRAALSPLPILLSKMSLSTALGSTVTAASNHLSSAWHNADLEEETRIDATDGLDNIQDLTCLTNLLDKCYTRHLTLLQNRPSALENIRTQFGWWSDMPNMSSGHRSRGSGYYVALAASHFKSDEDSHRNEFFARLKSSAGQSPLVLNEYGFDKRCGSVDRNPKDGMLYLHCSNPSCPQTGPTRVDRVHSWRNCTNCFTTYCSSECREQAISGHNAVCDFGRVRLVCGRLLHHLTSSQQSSLAALAKAGATRLGRGGVLITFASVQDAEFFLSRGPGLLLKQPSQHLKFVAADRPSPSGLVAPPIYLTVEEFNELDSMLAIPCRLYRPSTSYVLTVIVGAYDLEMLKNGRAVHLYKQYSVLPFPVTASTAATLTSEIKSPFVNAAPSSWTHPQTTKEEREVYSKRLQRTLRERGVSLRNSEPEVYRQLSAFVETGEPFKPVKFDLNDYYSNQVITCMIAPMKDAEIRQKADFETNVMHSTYQIKKSNRTSRPRINETDL